jgi:hypothetical protein
MVVIGGSAGSLRPLLELARALPADLPGSVAVTIHVGERARSRLPWLLSRAGPLPATHPETGEQLKPGHIYVAPPGRHMLLPGGVAELSCEPRVNRHRPAVDVMFTSAARWFGDRVVAVVLSGLLDDGAVGAAAVAQSGGLVVVQEPDDADQPSMPRAARAAVQGAITAPGSELGKIVSGMLGEAGLTTWPHPYLPEPTKCTCRTAATCSSFHPTKPGSPGWRALNAAGHSRILRARIGETHRHESPARPVADGGRWRTGQKRK